jgi:hypothetical protein
VAEVISIPGVKGIFAVGLAWRHEDSMPDAKVLRDRAAAYGRWGVVRKASNDQFQLGQCEPISGKSPGKLKSLAAIVVEHRPSPWRGLFELPDGRFWYIAVRDMQVIPGGDEIGTAEELRAVRARHAKMSGFPEELKGTIESLAEIVGNTAKAPVLRDLLRRKWVRIALIAGLVVELAGAAIGYSVYVGMKEKAEQEALAAQKRAIAAAVQAHNDAEARILPWTREPMPAESLGACASAWSGQLSKSGWTLAAWQCQVSQTGLTITRNWSRAGGVAADAPGTLAPDGQASVETLQVPVHFDVPSPLAATQAVATRAIWTVAQANGLALTVNAPTERLPLPGTAPANAQQVPWVVAPVTFSLVAPPWLNGIDASFDSLAGLRLKEVDWKVGTAQPWSAMGTLYSLRVSQAELDHYRANGRPPNANKPGKPT